MFYQYKCHLAHAIRMELAYVLGGEQSLVPVGRGVPVDAIETPIDSVGSQLEAGPNRVAQALLSYPPFRSLGAAALAHQVGASYADTRTGLGAVMGMVRHRRQALVADPALEHVVTPFVSLDWLLSRYGSLVAPATSSPARGFRPAGDLPPFPGSDWIAYDPPPPAVIARAQELNPQLWDYSTQTIRTPYVQEQIEGVWVTFQAAWHAGPEAPEQFMGTNAWRLASVPSPGPPTPQLEPAAFATILGVRVPTWAPAAAAIVVLAAALGGGWYFMRRRARRRRAA